MKKILPCLIWVFVLCGCAPTGPWVMVGGKQTVDSAGFEVDLPQGWMNFKPNEKDPLITKEGAVLLLTRDGANLQAIRINKRPVDAELTYTKKKLLQGMLPQELAEVIFDNIQSNPEYTNSQITENTPARIGDGQGFRLAYSYQTKAGLKKQGVCYGFVVDTSYYELSYVAPARFYFAKDLPTFERVKDSFRLLKVPGSSGSKAS